MKDTKKYRVCQYEVRGLWKRISNRIISSFRVNKIYTPSIRKDILSKAEEGRVFISLLLLRETKQPRDKRVNE